MENKKIIGMLNNDLDRIKNGYIQIINEDTRRTFYRKFILNNKETKKIDNRLLVINHIKNLRKTSKTDREFTDKLRQSKELIKTYPELDRFVNLTLATINKSKFEIPILEWLKQVVDTKNKEAIVKNIKEHSKRINWFVSNFKEEKIKHEIVYLLSLINETEIEYLREKYNELKTSNKDINQFAKEIINKIKEQKRYSNKFVKELENLRSKEVKEEEIKYLNKLQKGVSHWDIQGYSDQDIQKILEFYEIELRKIVATIKAHFKDNELVSEIQKNPAIRNLAFYSDEIGYFDYYHPKDRNKLGLLGKVYKGSREGDWRDFLDVVKNVKRESRYVNKHFGDELNAKKIIEIESKKHESLLDWEADIAQIVKELKSISNLNKILENTKLELNKIINSRLRSLYSELRDGKIELERIISRRISELENENENAVNNLDKTVARRLNELRNIEKKSSRKIMNKLVIETIKINAEWALIRRKYMKLEIKFVDHFADFIDKINVLSEKLDVEKEVNGISNLMERGIEYDQYCSKLSTGVKIEQPKKSSPLLTRLFFASGVTEHIYDQIEDLGEHSLNKVSQAEKDFKELEELYNKVIVLQKDVLSHLNEINEKYFSKDKVNEIELELSKEKIPEELKKVA